MQDIRTVVHIGTSNRFIASEIINEISDGQGGVDFDKLLPQPPEIKATYDETYVPFWCSGFMDGARWRFKNWGCNWLADNLHVEDNSTIGIEGLTFTFDTVDKSPLGWIEAFGKHLYDKYKLNLCGLYVPSKFGEIEAGQFKMVDGKFEHLGLADTDPLDFDEPLLVKEVWRLHDEDLLDFRGYIIDPNLEQKLKDREREEMRQRAEAYMNSIGSHTPPVQQRRERKNNIATMIEFGRRLIDHAMKRVGMEDD